MTAALDAARLLRRSRHGVLSTLSARLHGHPVGSVVPLVVDHDGAIVLLLSRLAEHTRNLAADPRAGLTVSGPPEEDVQAVPRLTVAGRCVAADRDGSAAERYLRLHPGARDHLRLDFDFHRILPGHLHYIGGFGVVKWFDGPEAAPPPPAFAAREAALAGTLQATRAADIAAWWARRRGSGGPPDSVVVAGVDAFGCDVDLHGTRTRIEFSARVHTAEEAADALAAVLHAGDA